MQFESVPGVYNPFDLHSIGVLGPVIHDVSPPYLRRNGWQSDPVMCILPTYAPAVPWKDWRAAYDDGVIRHQARNSLDLLVTEAAYRQDRKVLLFVWQKTHGLALLQSLDRLGVEAIFCTGQSKVQVYKNGALLTRKWTTAEIQQYVDEPGGKVVIGTSVIDEGADLPQTDILILAVAGKAFRRLRQRIGRGLRPKGGAYTVVFDHDDTHNFRLKNHSAMRRYVWAFDKIPTIPLGHLRSYAGFDLPEYREVYAPPMLKTTIATDSIVPGMPPGAMGWK